MRILPGMYADQETGLYYNGHRYYDPRIGRYISSDPIGLAGGLNTYSYAYNSPLVYTDPTGLCAGKPCDAKLPASSDAPLLARLIFAEATRGNGITATNRQSEMAAIAYTVINRSTYLTNNNVSPSFFGATSSSIAGVITPSQFGSLGGPNFNLAGSPDEIDTSTPLGKMNCDFLKLAITVSSGALAGNIADPFAAQGGVYGFRTSGHGGPGGSFYIFPPASQIPGSGNTFFGLTKP